MAAMDCLEASSPPTGSPTTGNSLPSECSSICGDETLTNPSFALEYDDPDTAEIESITCAKYEEGQMQVMSFLLAGATEAEMKEYCKQIFDYAKGAGCQCAASPAAHANVKIAPLVVVGVTFMASFFF
jgi:hypothetical protein